MGGIYRWEGDYRIPNIELPEQEEYQLGKYGRLHRSFLKEYHPALSSHNPHADIMLIAHPLNEKDKWQYKTEKEYLCVCNGEEKGFTADEFKIVQYEGWEKQYSYKVSKKKIYLPPFEAEKQGYVRVNKYPKSTKYGR